MATINIDLDGVVYPWHEQLALYVEEYLGLPLPSPTQWDIATEWGMTESQFDNWYRRWVMDDGWQYGKPIPTAHDSLWRLDELGHTIRIVTTRLVHKFGHAKTITDTVGWLDMYGIPYHDIAFVSHKTSKGDILCDYALDDSIKNVEDYMAMSVDAYIFNRPWNGYPEGNDICPFAPWRVDSWQNFEEVVADAEQTLAEYGPSRRPLAP